MSKILGIPENTGNKNIYILKSGIYFLMLILLGLTSCFKKDEQMFIIESKANQNVGTLSVENPYTIYNYYSYIDLDSLKVIKTAPISSWDLAFEASPEGWHVLVNSANGKEIYPTGSTDFTAAYSKTTVEKWSFDASSGNPDSTAVGKWVSGSKDNYQYTNQVYLIGSNNGDGTYQIRKKLVFKALSESGIEFIAANPDETVGETITINKDAAYSNVYYSFDNPKTTLLIEPPKNKWDIVAGSYRTIIFTDDGVPTPYTVRGVLGNYPLVKAVKVKNANFFTSTAKDTIGLDFSIHKDAVGYDWKDYNSKDNNPYRIVPDQYYFFITKSNKLVKFEFTGYVNANAEYGYPVISAVHF